MKNIVVFGSGGHARSISQEILKDKKYNFLGFVDETKAVGEIVIIHKSKKYRVIGSIAKVFKKRKHFCGVIGIGLNHIRQKVFKDIIKVKKNFKFEKIISRDAIINKNVKIGDGSVIMSGAVVNIGTNIGNHCIINTSCSIDHDNNLDNFTSIGPGGITGGAVIIKKGSHIGIGSVVQQSIIINEGVIIGSNSFVNKNCNKKTVYFGSPAKKIRKVKRNEKF